nr:hypothetical protein [Tanacetum cinerariifolium]
MWLDRFSKDDKSACNELINRFALQMLLIRFQRKTCLPEDIYAAVDSCETAQEIWLRVQQMMKGSDIGIQEKKAKLFNEWESHNGVDMLPSFIILRTYTQLIILNSPHQDQSPFNQNFLQQPMTNLEDITDLTTAMNMALILMAKAFKINYSTPTNNNHRISSNPRNRQIAQPGMNMGQDRQMQMIGGNGGNQFGQNVGNLNGYNEVQNVRNQVAQNLRVQNIGNGLIGVQGNGIQTQFGNGNLVAARAEGNAVGQNANQIRCYNCRGFGHYARNCTARPRRRDAAYLQTQLLIAQKEEAGIQLQAEDAPVYDSDGSAEVHENYDNNEIFNMFTQEEQYTELLEPILEPQQVPQNDNEVIFEVTGVEQDGEIVEQHSANFEETRALYESLYQNLAKDNRVCYW